MKITSYILERTPLLTVVKFQLASKENHKTSKPESFALFSVTPQSLRGNRSPLNGIPQNNLRMQF